jgi:hypothetical protein
MEINIQEIMNRANLLYVRSFIFEENPDPIWTEIECLTYQQRLDESSILLKERLRKLYSEDKNMLSNAMSEYTAAVQAYRDVYAEVGMKVGARLLFQLLFKDD